LSIDSNFLKFEKVRKNKLKDVFKNVKFLKLMKTRQCD